jgi:hypothetical protein
LKDSKVGGRKYAILSTALAAASYGKKDPQMQSPNTSQSRSNQQAPA